MTDSEGPQNIAEDLAFIQSFCPRFVPCYVEFDAAKGKHKKVPALTGWTNITPEQSRDVGDQEVRRAFFIFLTGDETGLFAACQCLQDCPLRRHLLFAHVHTVR